MASTIAAQLRSIASDTNTIWLIPLSSFILFASYCLWPRDNSGPMRIKETIPNFSLTYVYKTNHQKFMVWATEALKKTNIAQFSLGGTTVYLLAGSRNITALFAGNSKIGNEVLLHEIVLPRIYGLPPHEVDRFKADTSGRGKIPLPGSGKTVDSPQRERPWFAYDHIHHEYLSRTHSLNKLSESFFRVFSERLEKQPLGEWKNVDSIIGFCRSDVARSAMEALIGPRVFQLFPNFIETFWEFDSNIFSLSMGLPPWLNPRPKKVQAKYFAMIKQYVADGWKNYDWNGADADSDWEPHFGARVSREIVKWNRDDGFCDQTAAGFLGTLLFAQNSNSIPIAMWVMIELVHDRALFAAIRAEVLTTAITTPDGKSSIDTQALMKLPLLQSVFSETLRLHMSFNVMRQVKEPIQMGGFTLQKGAMLQAPMQVAHYDPAVWSTKGHSADEFWAERHVKYVDEKDENGNVVQKPTYALAGRPSSFFPFGGGSQICPGRFFAKHEILMTVALLVSKLDIEFREWTTLDGKPSNRGPKNDGRYSGSVAMPPDRDMKIRWRRIR